ncbi:MAG: hypothetical protein ABL904_07910 [Hyphomicrobiaceae bacterium]
MSSSFRSVASVLPFKSVVSPVASGPLPAVASDDGAEWRSLGGVAFAILADLDRRRPKLVDSPAARQKTKAA